MFANIIRFILNLFDFFYQKKIINFLKKNSDLKNIVDVGGHAGETVEMFLANFNLNSIFSFEPSKKNFKSLSLRFLNLKKKYKSTKIIIFNYGLGEKNYQTYLNNTLESSSSTINPINRKSKYYKRKLKYLMASDDSYISMRELIEIKTLDSIIASENVNFIDLLKIDTEGYEFKILSGVSKNFKNINYIYFEHHYDNMLDKGYVFSDIHNLLKKYDFRQVFKIKMPFRKTFEYIYQNNLYKK
jgi:FkbM family methyltransferase